MVGGSRDGYIAREPLIWYPVLHESQWLCWLGHAGHVGRSTCQPQGFEEDQSVHYEPSSGEFFPINTVLVARVRQVSDLPWKEDSLLLLRGTGWGAEC
jgi:hypothetical protein